jgi:membrane-associated phospholipid phosphatase
VLSVTELGMRISIGLADGEHSIRHALVHAYPSGHAARIPFLGAVLAMLVPPRWRGAVLAATAVLTVLEAFDRIDSTLQTASDVIGGTLMGTCLALTFAALLPVVERGSIGRLQSRT